MKMIEQKSYRIVHNDGTGLTDYENNQVEELMRKFQEARVLGDNSNVGQKQLLRMASVIMENYYYTPKKDSIYLEE
jgi:hypothetical protein